ncbi:MAG: EamA family transporter [Desulfamplus sp.]|nr:EamA family transporter [Desulfamplus sp.]
MVYLKLFLTAVLWGGTFIAGRFIAQEVNPFNAGFIRFAMASFFLLVITRQVEGSLPVVKKKQIFPILILGATGVFSYNVFFFFALHYLQAGKAALIIANNPILISLLSALIFKESLNAVKCVGIFMSVTGALVVISDGHIMSFVNSGLGKGEILTFGCVISWVAYSLVGKQIMGDLSPLVSVCYSSIAGTVMLFVPAMTHGSFHEIFQYNSMEWFSLFYLAFFGTVLGFLWYYEGIKSIGAMKSSVFINFVPVSAIIFSYFILNEPVGKSLLIGAILVISGVFSTNASDLLQKLFTKKVFARNLV